MLLARRALSGVVGADSANVKLSTNGYTATFATAYVACCLDFHRRMRQK